MGLWDPGEKKKFNFVQETLFFVKKKSFWCFAAGRIDKKNFSFGEWIKFSIPENTYKGNLKDEIVWFLQMYVSP